MFRIAQSTMAEVISAGSKVARFLGEGTATDGHRVLIYSASEIDLATASQAMVAFVKRHDVDLSAPTSAERPATRKAGKAKAA